DRSAVVRVLQESHDFRARTRAALALGASADPTMAAPLATALLDDDDAVRAAAAEGLARIGGPTQLSALRALARDPERQVRDAAARAVTAIEARVHAPAPPVRPPPGTSTAVTSPLGTTPAPPPQVSVPAIQWERTRYVVVLGSMENRSGYSHAPLANVLRSEVVRGLASVRGVGILTGAPDAHGEQEITRRHIRRFRLDGSIRTVRPQPGRDVSVRCEVSLMLLDDPGQNLRAALNGAATGTEPARGAAARPQQERSLAERALQGAVRSAMNGASRAISQSR
ncbi:MAG: HEAT repeat domain-containing protein, partial [Sandaracinaceae bacterium]|nr:HEAT repeat domain-containing protein [Sandaracinaceae bacterium]